MIALCALLLMWWFLFEVLLYNKEAPVQVFLAVHVINRQ